MLKMYRIIILIKILYLLRDVNSETSPGIVDAELAEQIEEMSKEIRFAFTSYFNCYIYGLSCFMTIIS